MKNLSKYNPLYWLSALGAGGLAVSFFVYANFMVPHKGYPMLTFDNAYPIISKGGVMGYFVGLIYILFTIATIYHLVLLYKNTKSFLAYKKTEAYEQLRISNNEVQLFAIPLTLAMTINVLFIAGVLFVPHIWSIVEYLFPIAVATFALLGYYVSKLFIDYASRVMTYGDFDTQANNSLAQMLSIFSFVMVGVGFSASAAMSKTLWVEVVANVGAIFFSAMAILLIIVKLVLGFKDILTDGISTEASPSMWIMIPILTLLGITLVRLALGYEHHFGAHIEQTSLFFLTAFVVSIQAMFAKLGYSIMKKNRYFDTYVNNTESNKASSVSLSLICPGVASVVFYLFFVHIGLVHNHMVDMFSVTYFALLVPAIYIQYKTIYYFFKIKNNLAI